MHARENIYIDGKWVAASGEGSIEIVNPATEQCIGSVPVGSAADVESSCARTAFPSWSQSSIEERQGYLNAISAAIAERGEEIAELITAEVGTNQLQSNGYGWNSKSCVAIQGENVGF